MKKLGSNKTSTEFIVMIKAGQINSILRKLLSKWLAKRVGNSYFETTKKIMKYNFENGLESWKTLSTKYDALLQLYEIFIKKKTENLDEKKNKIIENSIEKINLDKNIDLIVDEKINIKENEVIETKKFNEENNFKKEEN